MEFTAIDVETANHNRATICQIGIAKYNGRKLVDEWKSYIDPESFFEPLFVHIGGIDEDTVAGAPTFPLVAETVKSYLAGTVVVSHTPFDRLAIAQAAERYSLSMPEFTWLDSARIARRAGKK